MVSTYLKAPSDNVSELGTATFVVRGGKFVAQSFTAKITDKG